MRALGIRSAVFQFSRHCPLECGHCYISASPRETRELPINSLIEALEALRLISPGCVVGFTGGDPFSRIGYLREATKIARRLGFYISINTSAFFAKTEDLAQRILQSVEVDCVEISVDHFHLEFQPLERSKNCINAALELNLAVELHSLEEDMANNTGGISDLINKYDLPKSIPPTWSKINKTTDDLQDYHYSPCGYAFKIVIDEYGDVFPCCRGELIGSVKNDKPIFIWGNIIKEAPRGVFERIANSRELAVVRLLGPGASCDLLSIEHHGLSYCQSCAAACKSHKKIRTDMIDAIDIFGGPNNG